MAKKVVLANEPWDRCITWTDVDALAIQAIFRGDATEQQQKRAINFIVQEVCTHGYHGQAFDSASKNDYANGKRYVGAFILMLMRLKTGQLKSD